MQTVEPLRDKNDVESMKAELLKSGYRNYMLFVLGINTGLRIGDLLSLKVVDVRDKTHIRFAEQKTRKAKVFVINQRLRKDIDTYTKGMADNEYLFQSQKGHNQPISRVQAYRILNNTANKLGIDRVGGHTLRKTFGFWHYRQHKDVALLQDIFNHSSPSITLDYIGINQDIKDQSLENFYL